MLYLQRIIQFINMLTVTEFFRNALPEGMGEQPVKYTGEDINQWIANVVRDMGIPDDVDWRDLNSRQVLAAVELTEPAQQVWLDQGGTGVYVVMCQEPEGGERVFRYRIAKGGKGWEVDVRRELFPPEGVKLNW